MNRGMVILVAIGLVVVLALGVGYYQRNYTCSGLRAQVGEAKAARGPGGGTPAERRDVDDAARRARARDCDVADLVGQ